MTKTTKLMHGLLLRRWRSLLFPLLALLGCDALVTKSRKASVTSTGFVNPDVSAITEPLCLDTASRMQCISVPVSTNVHPDGEVGISFVHWKAESVTYDKDKQQQRRLKSTPPLILVHGFDSSCLEYRRLGSILAQRGIDTYAVDLLGWGFTQLDGVSSFSAAAKIEALSSFIDTVISKDAPFCIAGASLGGAAAIETAAARPNTCQGLILLDAQGFVDGIGPMAMMPAPIAKLGVGVLKSVQLRSSANQMSYFDKEQYATDEAVVVGRLHCLREGWDDALVSFMKSGGFSPSSKVPTIQAPSLVLWGRQDGILDGKEFANKFVETIPDASLQWIENCGHVPHLEQPQETADAIARFLQERVVGSSSENKVGLASSSVAGVVGVAGIAAAIAALAADFLPVH
ncbi:hypothetical protein MPSEU_000804500 [Mayamaea pseudoterrestris]|nr:hypothetical protein MPSEU_000804500 [Mayamaea pseudoterrestris]